MKSPLRVGAVAAPKNKLQSRAERSDTGKARRIASLSAAAAMVVTVGAASAFFVDYLADRALARAAEAPVAVKPVVAKALEASAETKVAALAPAPASSRPVAPPKTEIAVAALDPAAVAKVAVGPEHAIELPTDDPTASPILHAEEISATEDVLSVDENVPNEEPAAADAEDNTQTAAIAPDAAEPAVEEPPVKKPKRQKAEQAKPAVKQNTEIASLPGVDVGGLAGYASGEDDSAESTVRTITKPAAPAAANGGGVATGAARVTAAVNLRSSPKKGSGVLMVVPAGSAVNVLSCDGWCQIAYNGRKGWVYKNYLATSSKAKPQKQQTAKAAPAAQPAVAPVQRKAISGRLSDG